MDYKFNPLDYGYEHASLFPELSYQIPVNCDDWFIKIIAYDVDILCYWYSAIHINIGIDNDDDRIKISSSSHCIGKDYEKYDVSPFFGDDYFGLISTDEFAKSLLSHLFGCLSNNSVLKHGVCRLLNTNINQKMRDDLCMKESRLKTTGESNV